MQNKLGLGAVHQLSFTCCEGCPLFFRASTMCLFSLSLSGTYVQILSTRVISVLATATLFVRGWWEVKSRYWSVWVFFLYTDVDRDPSEWWVTKVSRKASDPFDSRSIVNLIVDSTMLRWSKN